MASLNFQHELVVSGLVGNKEDLASQVMRALSDFPWRRLREGKRSPGSDGPRRGILNGSWYFKGKMLKDHFIQNLDTFDIVVFNIHRGSEELLKGA